MSASPAQLARIVRGRRWSGASRVWALTVGIATGAALLFASTVAGLERPEASFHLSWPILALLFGSAEVYVVHFQFRRYAHSLSLSEIPLVLGLFFASPGEIVLGQLIGAGIALAFFRKQSPLKLSFNLSHFVLESCIAAMIVHTAGVTNPHDPVSWLGVTGATLVATVVGIFCVALAISLSESETSLQKVAQMLAMGTVITATNTSLALASVLIISAETKAAWLLLVPTVILFLTYRLYISERQKHDSIETLYESTRAVQRSLKVGPTVETLLSQARKMFRADIAEILLFQDDFSRPALQTVLGPGNELQMMKEVTLDPGEGVWARVVAEGRAVLLARPIQGGRLGEHFSERNIRDAMVAPLLREGSVAGVMMVANRLGDVSTFDGEDLKLFETLANHASISLENSRLVSRLEESLQHLTELNQSKDDFVASVSHELRTPLTSIQGYVKTMLRPDISFSSEDRQSFLEAIDRQSERLRRLIEDLLVVARMEAQNEAPRLSVFSLRDLGVLVTDELREKAEEHEIDLQIPEELPHLTSDPGKLHHIMSNLIENALKYSPQGTVVTVTAEVQGRGIAFSVADQGRGIPPEVQEKIFERFYQVDQSSTREVGGTGLGLYICRTLARSIGGHVWLESSGPDGSMFSAWIPFDLTDEFGKPVEGPEGQLVVLP